MSTPTIHHHLRHRSSSSLRRRGALALTAGLAAVALAACGGTDDPMAGHDMTPAPAPSTSASQAQAFNDADVVFAEMMIPHHEQAVEMSDVLLAKDGVDPEVAALAEQIRAAQQPEITTMTGWLDDWGSGMSDHGQMDHGTDDGGMMTPEDMQALEAADTTEAQQLYLEGMIVHHRGAIAMAEDEVSTGKHPDAIALAESITASQQAEVTTMETLLEQR